MPGDLSLEKSVILADNKTKGRSWIDYTGQRFTRYRQQKGRASMVRAKNIMTKEPITVTPDMEIMSAAKILLERGVNGVPVVDAGKLVGILCRSDLIALQKKIPVPSLFTLLDGLIQLESGKHFEKALHKIAATTVADAMTRNPVTVHLETSIEEIAAIMVDKKYHTIPVVEKGKLVGIIGKEDVLRTLMPGPKE